MFGPGITTGAADWLLIDIFEPLNKLFALALRDGTVEAGVLGRCEDTSFLTACRILARSPTFCIPISLSIS